MNKTQKNKLLAFFITLLFVCVFAFTAFTVMATTEAITIETARASQAVNLVDADTVTVSGNFREGDNYGITYSNGAFTATGTGAWRRAAMIMSNGYLSSSVAIKNGQEIATSAVTTYTTAIFNYSESAQNMAAGVLFGKRALDAGATRYYGLVISPTQKVVFVYHFDLNANGEWINEKQGPVSYDAKEYAANTDYKIEILMKSNGLDIYVGGETIATDFTTVYETNESVVGLTPIVGLNWCDISMTLSNITMQYLDAEVKEPALTIEDARESTAENILTKDTVTVSDNIRESWSNHGITYSNGVFTGTQTGNWERSAMILSNKFLKSEIATKDGQEVSTSAVTTYITATFNYSECESSRAAGVLFGKRALTDGATRYYGLVISPTQQVVFVYNFDLNANGECINEKQGPTSYDKKEYVANTDYKIEILMKSNGLDIYVGGEAIATDFTTVYETNESVVGLTPIIGLNWCDISMTLSNLSMQYLDAEAKEQPMTIIEARESTAENILDKAALTVTDNVRESWSNHDITYEDGVFTGTQLGGWQRSAMILSNKFLRSELATKDGQEVATSDVTTYTTATFNYSASEDSRAAGVLFGKRALTDGATRYYGLVISPTQQVVFVYNFDLNANGECINEKQGPASYDKKEYVANTDYKIEILMKSNGLDIYVGGETIATDFTTVYETNESVVGLTPIIGLNWCDISMTLSNLSIKFIDADAKVEVAKFTMEQARASMADNIVKLADVTASNNFREGNNYGITFVDGVFNSTATGNWSRSAMKLKSRYLNSNTVIMDGEKVASNKAAAYISVNLTFTAADEYKNIGTIIGMRENEDGYIYYAVVISFSQKIVFVYAFNVDLAGKYVDGSERQGPVSYTRVGVELGATYKLEMVLNPEVGATIAWDGAIVCEDLQKVYETQDSLLELTPVIGLSWADITGTAEGFVLKYLNAEVVPEKEEDSGDTGEEPTYPAPGPDPEINTEIIIPEVYRPETDSGCGSMVGAEFAAAVPLLAASIATLIKRRKSK